MCVSKRTYSMIKDDSLLFGIGEGEQAHDFGGQEANLRVVVVEKLLQVLVVLDGHAHAIQMHHDLNDANANRL